MMSLNDQLKQLPLVTKQNLSLVLKKKSDALDYWTKKLISQNLLIPLKKGVYTPRYYADLALQNPQNGKGYLEYIANQLRTPSYLSLEYRLAEIGFIPESVTQYTSITNKSTRAFDTKIGTFTYRSIKPQLFTGTETIIWSDKRIIRACPSKALFDYFYLKSNVLNSQWNSYLLTEGRFNWQVFPRIELDRFGQFVRISESRKMQRILDILQKEKII